jgi:hypothetical protein
VVERGFLFPALNAVLTGSHVATTDVIKELVITEEGSVAKGIRRLVAVTGHDAYEVQRKGKEFDAKLESIRGLQGKDKEAAMKPFLTVGTISIIESFAYWTGTWSKQYLSRQEEPAQRVFRKDPRRVAGCHQGQDRC